MTDPVTRAFAPGRVNLIGEHTDYNDGLALPFAVGAGITVTVTVTGAANFEVLALDIGERDEFPVAGAPEGAAGWRAFVRGAVGELWRAGVPVPGARIEVTGTVPRGGGLSSSAALEVALCLALSAAAGCRAGAADRLSVARICSLIEHDWVGTRSGLLDQLASLYGEAGHAVLIDFAALEPADSDRGVTYRPQRSVSDSRIERGAELGRGIVSVPLELGGHRLVTLDSGEQHDNAASGYNRRREECAEACELLGIRSLREATARDAERLPEPLARRARHVITENERVMAAVAAIGSGDVVALGELLNASHASLRDGYEVSTEAVERTVRRLHEAGAIGARLLGGGFGGHVLGLLPPGVPTPAGGVDVAPGPGATLTP